MSTSPEFVITLSHNKTNEKHVTLAFTLGLKAIEKGFSSAILLMLDGVDVGRSDYVKDIDIGAPFLPVADMLEVYLSEGGELLICGSCWKHAKLGDAERLAGAKMVTADAVIDMLMNAKSTLQLN